MDENTGLDAYKRNPDLGTLVEVDTELKNWLVEYVGNKMANDSPDVTVEMIVDCMARDFPEFLLAVAEENFIRGYRQAFADIESGKEMAASETNQ